MAIDINRAIEVLTNKISENTTPDEALKFTQAVHNLAHAASVLAHTDQMQNPA